MVTQDIKRENLLKVPEKHEKNGTTNIIKNLNSPLSEYHKTYTDNIKN